jgi:predicted SprT family Zn-dependent metalloprotease
MLLLKVRAGRAGLQLQFPFDVDLEGGTRSPKGQSGSARVAKILAAPPPNLTSPAERPIHLKGRDVDLELKARELLCALGASRIAPDVQVEWNSRLKTCAGRANYRTKVISLNPRLREVRAGLAAAEIERTFLHELAHLLAQFRAGRRRIAPHGVEWRNACRDLGIAGEARCHNLPFPITERSRRFLYKCPNCKRDFPRVRKVRRAIACLACCHAHNGGEFDARFRLTLVQAIRR